MTDWQNVWNQTFAKHRLKWVYNLSSETLEFLEKISVMELKPKNNNQLLWLHHATHSDLSLFLATDGNMFGFVREGKYLVAGILTENHKATSPFFQKWGSAFFIFFQKVWIMISWLSYNKDRKIWFGKNYKRSE